MQRNEFYKEVKARVGEALLKNQRGEMYVEINEILKNNDVKLCNLSISKAGSEVVPAIYLEEFFEAYSRGVSLEDITKTIIESYEKGVNMSPKLENVSVNFDDIKDRLVVQLADSELNKERLKSLIYKPLENGMVMTAYVTVKEEPEGAMRFAITKDIARSENYDVGKLFDIALANTRERYEPSLTEMSTMLFSPSGKEITNPFEEGFQINLNENILVLTNKEGNLGAITLFYPDMQKRIGELINNNYYVIPSSIHEVLIVPENSDPGLAQLQSMVKEVNAAVVDSKEVLSNRIFMYDREKDRLFEPEERAKVDKEMEVR